MIIRIFHDQYIESKYIYSVWMFKNREKEIIKPKKKVFGKNKKPGKTKTIPELWAICVSYCIPNGVSNTISNYSLPHDEAAEGVELLVAEINKLNKESKRKELI